MLRRGGLRPASDYQPSFDAPAILVSAKRLEVVASRGLDAERSHCLTTKQVHSGTESLELFTRRFSRTDGVLNLGHGNCIVSAPGIF
jgi:hypothetical protein